MPSKKSSEFHVQDIPSLEGHISIVTGATLGLAMRQTLQVALRGGGVYVAAWSPERANTAAAPMKLSSRRDLDLQCLHSVKEAADTIPKRESLLDILINNIMAVPFKLTIDGVEAQCQTIYSAPLLLVKTLLPVLELPAATSTSEGRVRIMNVSSDAAFVRGPKALDLSHPNLEYVTGGMAGWKWYGHSKMASLIHARALHDRHQSAGISTFSVQPDVVFTNLLAEDRSLFGFFVRHAIRWGIMPGTISVADGARRTLFCATSSKAVEKSGGCIVPCGRLNCGPDEWDQGDELTSKLWTEGERMVKQAGL